MARILVVDDEPDVRELFNITLKMAGHETDTVKHGLEAIERLATDSPDLIVLDLMMPHMDGFTFLSHVRAEMPSKPMRVLVATAKVLEDADQERLGDWPVVGILNKGELDIGQMVLVVSTALGKSALKEGVIAAPAPAPEKAATQAAPATPTAPVAPPTAPPAPAPVKPAPQPATGTTSTTYTRPTTGIPTPVPQPTFGPKTPPAAPAEPAKPAAAETEGKPAAEPVSSQSAASGSSSTPAKPQNAESSSPPAKPAGESEKSAEQPKKDSADEPADKPVPPRIAP